MDVRIRVHSKDGYHMGHVSAVAVKAVAVERTNADGRRVRESTVDDVVQAIVVMGNVILSDPYSSCGLYATIHYDVGVASASETSTTGELAHQYHLHRGGSMICLSVTNAGVNESASANTGVKMTENANVSSGVTDVDDDVYFDDVDHVVRVVVVMSVDAREMGTVKTQMRYVTMASVMVNASVATTGTMHVRS